MDLIGGVQDPRRSPALEPRTPVGLRIALVGGRDEGRQVRHRAAAREKAPGLRRVADQLTEPGDDPLLDRVRRRRELPEVAVLVDGGGDRLGEGRDPRRPGEHVGEEARVGDVRRARQHRAPELAEELLEGAPLLGDRLGAQNA